MELPLAVALIALAGTVVSAVLVYRSSRMATRVNQDANELQRVKELRAEAAEAKQEVKDLRGEVKDLRRQLDVVTREAEQLVAELQLFRRTAWREGMTMDRFREFIGPPGVPARNGRAS